MKKINVFMISALSLCVLCFAAFIGLSVAKSFAEEHYKNNETYLGKMTSADWAVGNRHSAYEIGCSESDCKYCNGKIVEAETNDCSAYEGFLYYKTISGFKAATLVAGCVSGGLFVLLILFKYRQPIIKLFKKKQ